MQTKWKKVGAILGGALMIGSTLAGAAIAQETAMDLGDYNSLIASNGSASALFVVGSTAATADVVTAIDMAAYVGTRLTTGGSGDVTLTPMTTLDQGVKRHVQFGAATSAAYEFNGGPITLDRIGPWGYASGDGAVGFLHNYQDKGYTYVNATEKKWHEEAQIDTTSISAVRDTMDSNQVDQYDELFVTTGSNDLKYKYSFDDTITPAQAQGKKIWFMGQEYVVISASENTEVKLGSVESRVLLTTTDSSATIAGVDVTLDGVFSAGTSATYQGKITVSNAGTTESKFITSGTTDTIAGIEIYVENAVVTTSGTNEGEAEIIVGAGILKLEDGGFLSLGDGTETKWLIALDSDADTSGNLDDIVAQYADPRTTTSDSNAALAPGDSIMTPNGAFGLTFTGVTDIYGGDVSRFNVDVTPTTRDLDGDGTTEPVISIKVVEGPFIGHVDASTGVSGLAFEVLVNVSKGSNAFLVRDTTQTSVTYKTVAAPSVVMTAINLGSITYTAHSTTAGNIYGFLSILDPVDFLATQGRTNITMEYNASANSGVGQFEEVQETTNGFYVYYADNSTDGAAATYIARDVTISTTAPSSRDYYTVWGTYVDSAGPNLVSLQYPVEQIAAEIHFGTSMQIPGTAVEAKTGEDVVLDSGTYGVSSTLTGSTANLPSTLAKTDAEVTSADKNSLNLVLVGGPAVNTLVKELQNTGTLTTDVAGLTAGSGVIELITNAFSSGKYAIVVAGSDRAGTKAAGNILAHFDDNAATLDGKTTYEV